MKKVAVVTDTSGITLEEAKKFFEALPFKKDYRIAESYVVVRYKPVKLW